MNLALTNILQSPDIGSIVRLGLFCDLEVFSLGGIECGAVVIIAPGKVCTMHTTNMLPLSELHILS